MTLLLLSLKTNIVFSKQKQKFNYVVENLYFSIYKYYHPSAKTSKCYLLTLAPI